MKDTDSIHKKLQDMCNCFATSDPLKEMSILKDDTNKGEAAVKWLSLAALHGVNNNAEKVSIIRTAEGNVRVTAEYRKTELPSPGSDVAEGIFAAVREITHIEGKKGKSALALGIRDSNLDLRVKLKLKDGKEKVVLEFPR